MTKPTLASLLVCFVLVGLAVATGMKFFWLLFGLALLSLLFSPRGYWIRLPKSFEEQPIVVERRPGRRESVLKNRRTAGYYTRRPTR